MRTVISAFVIVLCAAAAAAQEAGNRVYRDSGNQVYNRAGDTDRPALAGDLLLYDPKDMTVAPYVEAYVLMNVKPDAFVAVFAIAQEGKTADESNAKVDRLVAGLLDAVQIDRRDVFVDFISQTPVYDFTVAGRTAREGLTGFQTKKTVSVRYADRALLARMIAAAARLGVYDLVKVDYVVSDYGPVRERLFEEASKVIARKEAAYARLLGVHLKSKVVAEERYRTYQPADRYESYTAFEGSTVEGTASTRVVERRKTSTAYYDPLTGSEYDAVVAPAGVEPVVQCTLFLKVRCEWAQP